MPGIETVTASTTVTFPSGAVTGTSRLVAAVPLPAGTGLVVAETPFHPLDHTWPDQPADHGTVTAGGQTAEVRDCVTGAVEHGGTELLLHRRARHPDPGPGRPGGRDRPPAGRPLQPPDRRGPAGPRDVVRPVHADHHQEPLRGGPGDLQGAVRQRLHLPEDHDGRDLAVHRPYPPGPLHRRHLPDL